MEDDLKILKFEYLSNQSKKKLEWKMTFNIRQAQDIKS